MIVNTSSVKQIIIKRNGESTMKSIEIEKLYKDLGISISNLKADYNPDLYAKKNYESIHKKEQQVNIF